MATMNTKKANKPKPKKAQPETTTAFHAISADGEKEAVGILKLHVLIVPDGRFWFAQGLEIDYAAQGTSVDDTKLKFQNGLAATVKHHLRIFGDIEKLLRVAPNEDWLEFYNSPKEYCKIYSQVTFHEVIRESRVIDALPYREIEYTEVRPAATAA